MKTITLLSTMVALINGQTQNVGAVEAKVGEHRYVAGIISCFEGELTEEACSYCGGSLIAPNAILTSATCLAMEGQNIAHVGSHFATTLNSRGNDGVLARVVKTITHPWFSYRVTSNEDEYDVAILLLDKNITTIQPVQVSFTNIPGDIPAVVRGWGTYAGQNVRSNVLMEINAMTMSQQELASQFPGLTNGIFMGTLGPSGRAICRDDPGSPVTIEENGSRAKLVGITSFNTNTGQCSRADVHARLSFYRDFIKSHCKESSDKCIPCTDCDFVICQ
jgi:secreted trypsin-like serine protease